jgi:hypothetical protein
MSDAVFAMPPGSRIDVTNVASSLMLAGSHVWDAFKVSSATASQSVELVDSMSSDNQADSAAPPTIDDLLTTITKHAAGDGTIVRRAVWDLRASLADTALHHKSPFNTQPYSSF